MITDNIIKGKSLTLRQIELSDCNESYVKWLNDTDVNQYLETKWYEQTIETITAFVDTQRNNMDSILFAIVENQSGKHIGNIKIGPLHPHYHHADISYFIGEKDLWNKGYTTEAIYLICKYGFDDLKLHRIEAGAYDVAVGSWKALEKNGFKREGTFREQVYFKEKYIDIYRYGLLKDEWKEGE